MADVPIGRLRRYALPLEDNYDWRRHLIASSDAKYDYWILPAGVRLYHGTKATFPDNQLPTGPTFYSSLDVAGSYAFALPSRRGEQGKVITVETTRPIRLLDVTSRTLRQLMDSPEFFPEDLTTIQQLFVPDGPSGLRRRSIVELDRKVSALICAAGFSGFGYPYVAGFHPEIMLCPGQPIQRVDLEYREVQQDTRCLFGLSSAGIVDILPANLYDTLPRGKPYVYPYIDRRTDAYLPYLRQHGQELCQPVATAFSKEVQGIKRAIDNRDFSSIYSYLEKGIVNGEIFRYALATGDPEIVRVFLDAGMDLRYIEADSPFPIIALALSYGADPYTFIPAIKKDPALIPLLIEAGIDQKYLFDQAKDNLRLLSRILAAGANPNAGLIPTEPVIPREAKYFDTLLSAGADNLDYIAEQLRSEGTEGNLLFFRQYLDRILPFYGDRISPESLIRLRDAIASLDRTRVERSGLSRTQRLLEDLLIDV